MKMWYYKENWTDGQTRAERHEEKREREQPKNEKDYHDFVGYYDYEEWAEKETKIFVSFFKKGIDNTAPMWYIIITKGR